jgi:hypothetical protein
LFDGGGGGKGFENLLKETSFDEGVVDVEGLQGLAPLGFGDVAGDGLLGQDKGLFVILYQVKLLNRCISGIFGLPLPQRIQVFLQSA